MPDAKNLSQQEKDDYVARAQSGSQEAREAIITHLLHRVASYAGMYYATYSWASPQMSYEDLVQAGNMEIMEHIDQVLVSGHTNPYGYLTLAAYQAIRHYAKRYSSMIVTPYTAEVAPLSVGSLDAPLSNGEGTLYELIADELEDTSDDESKYSQTIDFDPLYEALDTVGSVGRTVIVHHYGLFGHTPLSLQEIKRNILKRDGASGERTRTLDRLHRLLASKYPQFCTSTIRPGLRRPGELSERALTPGQLHRLDQAYAALCERGEKITADRLRVEAHIARHIASKYLRRLQQANPQETVEQRLERVYNELEARGERFTVEQHAKLAGVRFEIASEYVSARRGPALTQDERLEKAYTRMQAHAEKITVPTLCNAARVDAHKTADWLKTRRIAEGMRPVRNGGVIHWVTA
jgi:RNA polymerase sigma factor (sigma-70 family)